MTCVRRLFPKPPASTADWRRVELAVGIWADFPRFRLESLLKDAGHDVTKHIETLRAWLQLRMSDIQNASAAERARAGDALATLGDSRFDPEHWFLPKEEMLGFMCIVADKGFRIGTRGSDFKRVMLSVAADIDTYPDEINDAPTPTRTFYVGKYPVTVAQFRAFVNATEREVRHRDALRDPDNRPVRWVTWHEAMAYCAWIETQLNAESVPARLRDLLRSGKWRVTLPSELEWEKAARGGLQDKIYTWDGGSNPEMANYSGTHIGTTSAVGCFPANGYRLHDMIGNVWEWTRSEYRRYPYDVTADLQVPNLASDAPRVLRGGAFNSYERNARSACRYVDLPPHDFSGIGFRVVLAPSTPDFLSH